MKYNCKTKLGPAHIINQHGLDGIAATLDEGFHVVAIFFYEKACMRHLHELEVPEGFLPLEAWRREVQCPPDNKMVYVTVTKTRYGANTEYKWAYVSDYDCIITVSTFQDSFSVMDTRGVNVLESDRNCG